MNHEGTKTRTNGEDADARSDLIAREVVDAAREVTAALRRLYAARPENAWGRANAIIPITSLR